MSLGAEKVIATAPVESSQSVEQVYTNYRKIDTRWMGETNAKQNEYEIEHNRIFAKSEVFNPDYQAKDQIIKFYRLSYQTKYLGESHNVSGLVLLPPQKKPKGVILFFHSTMASKLQVPSMRFEQYKSQMLAAIFAADGYVVISPDYIGLGNDFRTEHPYIIYPRPNVDDGKDMLIASLDLLNRNGILFNDNKMPLFVSGYSEGGSYALWFSKIYQQDHKFKQIVNQHGYYLEKTVPIEGAYDVSEVMFPFLLSNQINESQNKFNINTTFWGSLLKPSLLANALSGYAAHNNLDIRELINPAFYMLSCINGRPWCSNLYANYTVETARLFDTNQLLMSLNYYFQAYGIGARDGKFNLFNNSVKSLVNPELLVNESGIYKVAREANIVKWKSASPVTFISLASDSLVPEANSANAYAGMRASGSTNLDYIKVPNGLIKARSLVGPSVADHVSFELYALLIALNQFNLVNTRANIESLAMQNLIK